MNIVNLIPPNARGIDSFDLTRAIDRMPHGMVVFDGDLVVRFANASAANLIDVPTDWLAPGMSFERVIRHAAERGDLGPGDVEGHFRDAMSLALGREPYSADRMLPGGRVIQVRGTPLDDGGFVITYTDVTREKQLERELPLSERKLRNVIDGSIQGFILFGREGRIIYANQALAEMFGYDTPEKIVALQAPTPLVAPEDRDLVAQMTARRLRGERAPDRFECRGLRRDGSTFWVSARQYLVEWDGETALQSVVIDIDRLRRREEEIRDRTQDLVTILDNMSEGIALVDADLRLKIFNPQFLDLVGIPRDRFDAGDRLEDIVRYNAARYPGNDAARVEQVVNRALGPVRRREAHQYELKMPNGLTVGVQGNPIPGGGFVISYSDVTAARQAERELEEAETRYRTLVESAPEALVVLDTEAGCLTDVNREAERLFGLPREELMRRHPADLSPPVQPDGRTSEEAAAAYIQQGLDGRQPVFEWVHQDAYGRPILTEVRLVGLPHRGRRLVRGSLIDIRARKEAEKELRRAKEAAELANRTKTQFLANMSHELRTPLNAIIGFAEVLRDEVMGPVGNDAYRGYAADIETSGRLLLQIISDILDISKVEAGAVELDEQEVRLPDLFADLRRLFEHRIRGDGLGFHMELEDGLPALRADPRLLKQIIGNLLANAIKFSPTGALIRLRARRADEAAGGGVDIAVEDRGVGIARDDLRRIMLPFQQAHNTWLRTQEGTGLGLPLSKRLTELHGARFHLESDLGRGTVVTLAFPPGRVIERG